MDNVILIGVCGGSASGKTTITKMLERDAQNMITVLAQDNYYNSYDELTINQKKQINYDHPDAFDVDLLKKHLEMLKNNCEIDCPIYSFLNYCREKDTLKVIPNYIVLVEGMLILHYPEIRKLLDYAIYIDTSENVRIQRMINRDVKERGRTVESVIFQYKRDMKPMHNIFVEPQKKYADFIVNGDNSIEKIYSNVKNYLSRINVLCRDNKNHSFIKKMIFYDKGGNIIE